MKISVVGGRNFKDYELLKKILSEYTDIEEIISGGADGTDRMAWFYGLTHGITVVEYLAQWEKYGLSAGHKRNPLIIRDGDIVIAFWDGNSSGTRGSIKIAKRTGKPLRIIRFESFISKMKGLIK